MPKQAKTPKTLFNPKEHGCYVARKPCGCCAGTAYNLQDKSTGRIVAAWINAGLTVNHVDWTTFQAVCKEETYLQCPHQKST